MAEASKGGWVRSAVIGSASTRSIASASGTLSPGSGSTPSSRRSSASATGISATSGSSLVSAGFPAGLFDQPDVRNHHGTVDRLGHVVDGQAGDGRGGKRFHLDPGLAGDAGKGGNFQAGQGVVR